MGDSNVVQVTITGNAEDLTAVLQEAATGVQAQTQVMAEGFAKLTAAVEATTVAIGEAATKVEAEVEHEAESIGASLKEAGAHFTEFAEQAKISSLSTFSTFGALGAAIGGGIFVAAFGEAINKTREMAVEAEHLSAATGAPIEKIGELKSTVEELGGQGESVDKILTRLSRSMVTAAQGGKQQADAFKALGVDTSNWEKTLPSAIDVLLQMSDHMQNSTHATQDFGEMSMVAGRNVMAMTGILKEGREELEKHMASHRGYGQALAASAESAMKLTSLEHNLGETFKELALEILPPVVTGIKALYTALEWAGTGLGYIAATAQLDIDIIKSLTHHVNALGLMLRGNFDESMRESNRTFASLGESWERFTNTIKGLNSETKAKVDAIWAEPMKQAPTGETNTDAIAQTYNPINKAREQDIENAMAHDRAIFELQKEATRQSFEVDAINSEQRLAQLDAIADSELSSTRSYLQKKSALYDANDPDRPAALEKIKGDIQKAEDQALATKQKNLDEFTNYSRKVMDTLNRDYVKGLEAREKKDKEFHAHQAQLEVEATQVAHKVEELQIQEQQKQANDRLDIERKNIDLAFQFHQISALQKTALLQHTYEEEYALQVASLRKEIDALDSADKDYLVKKQKLENDIKNVEDKADAQRISSQNSMYTTLYNQYSKFYGQMTQALQNNVQMMLNGQRSFAQGMAGIGMQIVSNWEKDLVTMLVKFIQHKLVMLSLHTATSQAQVAVTATTEAEKQGIETVSAIKSIAKKAASAAAGAWDATVDIPIVGPILAPIAAAGAFAGVMALGASVSAERGAILPNAETLVHAHPEEMMLPQSISKGLQNVAAGGTMAGRSGDTNLHFNYNHFDQGGRLTDSQVSENGERVMKDFKKKLRKLNLGVQF